MARWVEDPNDPDHVIDLDEVDHDARLRAERAVRALPLDEARRARLEAEEATASEPASSTTTPSTTAPPRRVGAGLVMVLWGLGLPLAILVRLVTLPARGALLRWLARRADRARVRALHAAMRKARDAEQSGRAATWLASGLAWIDVGQPAHAEAAFDAAMHAPDATEAVRLAATRNRGVARAQMRLPKLAARDLAASGPTPRGGAIVTLIEALTLARIGLTAIAGLDPDE